MANETVLFKRGDSATITSTPVTDGQILFDTSGNGKMYLDNGTDRLEMGGAITVDASLSKTSTNAIQNKAVTGNILNSLAEVSAATQQNTIAGALALKEVNNSLADKVSGFASGNYESVTGLAYDPTNKQLGLKVGADSVIPFSGGWEDIKVVTLTSALTIDIGRKPKEVLVGWSATNVSTKEFNVYYYYNEDFSSYVFGLPGVTGVTINDNGVTISCRYSGRPVFYAYK